MDIDLVRRMVADPFFWFLVLALAAFIVLVNLSHK